MSHPPLGFTRSSHLGVKSRTGSRIRFSEIASSSSLVCTLLNPTAHAPDPTAHVPDVLVLLTATHKSHSLPDSRREHTSLLSKNL